MSFKIISIIFIIIFNSVFAVFVYLKRRALVNLSYALFVIFMALWSLGILMMYMAETDAGRLFAVQYLYFIGGLIATLFLYFSFIFSSDKSTLPVRYNLIFLPNFLFFALYFFTPMMIKGVVYEGSEVKYFVFGRLHLLFDIQVSMFFGWAFLNLYRKYRTAFGHKKMQLRYILLASIIGVILAGATNIIMPSFFNNCSVAWLGPWFTFPMLCIITYAIIRYRLMDIKVAITRAGIFLPIYTIVLGLPLFIGYKTKAWFLSTSLAIFFATIGPIVYRSLHRKAEELLLIKQRSYQTLLLKGAKGLMREHDLERLLKWIVRAVRKTVGIRYVALLLYDKKEKLFILKAKEDNGEIPDSLIFSNEHPFVTYMKERKCPFLYEEIPVSIRQSLNIPFDVDIVIPAFTDQNHLGFLILGEKLNHEFYSVDDINVFKILAHQAGLAIENAQLYSDLQTETKALREAIKKLHETQDQLIQIEKMAAVGRLASGIAHELRNPLATILQGMEFIKGQITGLDDKSKKVISNIEKSIDRANNIINELLTFSRTSKLEFTKVKLCGLLEETLSLVENRVRLNRIQVVKNFPQKEIEIHADRNMLEQVFFNIYSNAIDEMENGGALTLNVFTEKETVVAEVSDTGKGISPDQLPNIFDPFFTTKPVGKGVGLGLSIVRLILERHQGTIYVESKINEGAKFIIRLPKKMEKKEEAL